MRATRRRCARARRTERARHWRWLGAEADFFGHVLDRAKFFPVGSFKDWLASPLFVRLAPRLGSYYRAERVDRIAYDDQPIFAMLPKSDSFYGECLSCP